VRAANKAGGNAGGSSFEQLVELGKANKQLDANDQGVVQVVDWLWQYALTSVPVTSTWSRAVSRA
jgi:general secretion pathway protein E